MDAVPDLEVLKAAVLKHAPPAIPPQQTSSLEVHRERIEALQGKGLRPKAIYDRLRLEEPTFSGSLGAVKRLMARLARERGPRQQAIRYSQHFESDGASLLAKICELGGEGIVSKRRDQPHRPGRGDRWQKSKCTKRAEFVIGGFTDPGGSRMGIGALLLGHYDEGVLRFAGKVGTGPGFTAEYLEQVRRELTPLEQKECPFTPPPPGWLGRHGHWVRPVRRGEVAFTEWTLDGTLRHPLPGLS